MKIDLQKFLAMTAVLAAGAAQACSSDDSSGDGDGDSTGDGDGDAGDGDAGDGDAGDGDAGDGDAGDGDGDGGGAPGDGDGDMGGNGGAGGAGGAGLVDECVPVAMTTDATCESLNHGDSDCLYQPYAVTTCYALEWQLNTAAFEELHGCLSEVPLADACSEDSPIHSAAVTDCIDALADDFAPQLCDSSAADDFCADLACPDLAAGQCEDLVGLLPDDATAESAVDYLSSCIVVYDATTETSAPDCAALRDCVLGYSL